MPELVRVLMVEDVADDAALIERELRRAGIRGATRRVDSEPAYREALQTFGPDIILTDHSLPTFGAADALRIALLAAPDTPVIVVTGSLDEETAAEYIKAGAADYVVKHHLERVGPAVMRALDLRRARTEQARAEEARRQGEERFRALIEHGADAVALVAPDGTVLFASHSIERLLGFAPAELVGHPGFERVHPNDVPRVHAALRHIIASPGTPAGLELRWCHKDGSWRHIDAVAVDRLAEPAVGAIVLNFRDLTERLPLEQQLGQSQKIAAAGGLADGIADDFYDVLTAIPGYADLLLEDLGATDPRRKDADEIHKAADRAAGLTRQLLAFSRQQVLQPTVLEVNKLVSDLEKMLRRLLGEDVELSTRLAPTTGRVKADPGQLEQVVMNLAVNARDAMPSGGKLTLETANVDLDEAYAADHYPARAGPFVMLAVSDTGIGMSEETQAHMFEPFFTTKEKGKGTGLGLATVYGIIKQSGGFIWVYSEVGHGTTFKLYLPRVEELAERAAAPAPARTRPARGTETVLVVEDEAPVRNVARQVLERHGYSVLEAPSAEAALDIATRYSGTIHLLLTDVVMPGLNGRELASRLADLRPDARVIFMSGYTDDAVTRHGVLEPGSAYVQKPFTPDAIARKVREVLDQ